MAKVFIDAGHGGTDSGAVYRDKNGQLFVERDINLVVSFAEKETLERHGVEVKMSRYDNNTTVGLQERCDMANSFGADIFHSCHHNAGGADRGEAIFSIIRGISEQLALKVDEELKKIGQTVVKDYSRQGSNGDYYAVIRGTKMPAIISEGCFLDNESDNDLVDTIEEQKAEGVALAKAILRQLGIAYQEPQSQPQPQTQQTGDVYIVKSGDTLSKIASMYGTTWQELARINSLSNPSLINVGQKIITNKPAPQPQPTPVVEDKIYGVVTASVLNVRSGRGTGNPIIGKLNNGEKVRLDQLFSDGWWSIYYGSSGGFVSAQYIKRV
jgi:N-acetylmuramoyl-L-alanine amidase